MVRIPRSDEIFPAGIFILPSSAHNIKQHPKTEMIHKTDMNLLPMKNYVELKKNMKPSAAPAPPAEPGPVFCVVVKRPPRKS